jgi:hypothetical protein
MKKNMQGAKKPKISFPEDLEDTGFPRIDSSLE